MTRHRLIRSNVHHLVACAARRHAALVDDRTGAFARWFTNGGPPGSAAVRWLGGPLGWRLEWCLEVERNASGVLAHLTVAPAVGSARPRLVSQAFLNVWTTRELAALAHAVETQETTARAA